MRTVVFINSHSRQASKNLAAVQKAFSKPGLKFKVIDFIVVEDLEKFDLYLQKLRTRKDMECVFIGSGDGTLNTVINVLRDRKDIVYGFLALGTTNAFVR